MHVYVEAKVLGVLLSCVLSYSLKLSPILSLNLDLTIVYVCLLFSLLLIWLGWQAEALAILLPPLHCWDYRSVHSHTQLSMWLLAIGTQIFTHGAISPDPCILDCEDHHLDCCPEIRRGLCIPGGCSLAW